MKVTNKRERERERDTERQRQRKRESKRERETPYNGMCFLHNEEVEFLHMSPDCNGASRCPVYLGLSVLESNKA